MRYLLRYFSFTRYSVSMGFLPCLPPHSGEKDQPQLNEKEHDFAIVLQAQPQPWKYQAAKTLSD